MSIASVAKLFGPKMQNYLKIVMKKGFKVQGQVPNTLLKQVPGADEFLKTAKTLGYNKVSLQGGIKGGKNTVTGLVKAYSGKTKIGYMAVGLDANAPKPILQAKVNIVPLKGGEKIRFNIFANGNRKITDPLDAVEEYSAKKGKLNLNIDTGAIKGHLDGDVKSISEAVARVDPSLKDKTTEQIMTEVQRNWKELFTI